MKQNEKTEFFYFNDVLKVNYYILLIIRNLRIFKVMLKN